MGSHYTDMEGEQLKRSTLIVLLISVAVLGFLGMTLFSIFFGYLIQSSNAKAEDRLTFDNHLFPYLLSAFFLFYVPITYAISGKRSAIIGNWIKGGLIVVAAAIAIPWQIRYVSWGLRSSGDDSAIGIFLLVTFFTVVSVIMAVRRLFR